MAEPLSIAASIAGLLSLSLCLLEKISKAVSTPSDIRSLGSELKALCVALANLEAAVIQVNLSNHARFPNDHLVNVLDSIMKDFILLQTIVLETIGSPAESVLTRWAKRVTSVSRGAEVGALRNKLEAYKTTILIITTTSLLLTTTATSEGIEALQTELRQLSEHLGLCMTRSTRESETQSQRRTICGSTRSGITLRRSPTTTTSNRDDYSLSESTGETPGRSTDGAGYAASVYSNRSAQSQLSSRSSQYTYEAMSIIDMYVDSIYPISQSSVGSFHVPSANAAFPDATPSEPPIPILLPSESSEKRRGIYRRLVCQGINQLLKSSITYAWVIMFMRTYRSKEGRGLMETIMDIEDLHTYAVLLLSLRGLGGSIPFELLEDASVTPAELKEILILQVRSRREHLIGKMGDRTTLLSLRALGLYR